MTELIRVNLFLPGMLIGFGARYLIETFYAYRGGVFATMTVAALLKKIKVSHIRPVQARIKGRVIGRGVPGLIWSEDVVLQDETGFIFADYRHPLRLIEFLFGLLRTGEFIGEQVTVTGWYRRSPVSPDDPGVYSRAIRKTSSISLTKWKVISSFVVKIQCCQNSIDTQDHSSYTPTVKKQCLINNNLISIVRRTDSLSLRLNDPNTNLGS